jgi:hypothetical protein
MIPADSKPARALDWMRRRRGALTLVAMLGVVVWAKPMGLLLWARIRILTSIPKTAIADEPQTIEDREAEPPEIDTGIRDDFSVITDPFAIDGAVFPSPTRSAETARSEAPIFKPETVKVENQRPDGLETARRAAERFRLQSAGAGLTTAVIDGRTLRIGDILESSDGVQFTLVEVREQSVVLECDGQSFEIGFRGTGFANGGSKPSSRRP